MTTTTNNKPTTLRDGNIKATLWKNTGEKGPYFSIQFTRTWKDEQGFHDSDRFSGVELLRLAHLATKAYDYMNREGLFEDKEGTAA